MLTFEIGQRESGFYSERTDTQTDRITEPSSTVLVGTRELQPSAGFRESIY